MNAYRFGTPNNIYAWPVSMDMRKWYSYDWRFGLHLAFLFGPFLKWNGLFINVNKKYDFDNLSNEEIETLIKEKIQKEKEKLIKEWPQEGIRIEKARWGRSNIIMGSKKAELGKDIDPTKITLETAIQFLKPKTGKKKNES